MRKHEKPRRHRYQMYAILIVCTLGLVAGRIATVINREGDSAMLSANDRSRWVTMAALVEQNTYAIDNLIVLKTDKGHRLWDTIDKVRHVGWDGRVHYYSSKPTLLTTLLAGPYWMLNRVTGLKMTDHPIYVPRLLLLLINLPVLAVFLVTMAMSIESIGASDFARRMGVTVACFGTMVTPFAIALNNHLFAAAATSLTLWLYLRSAQKIDDSFAGQLYNPLFLPWFGAGVAAGFTVACELPALSMFCLWAVLFGWLRPTSLPGFVMGGLVVAVGIFGTNFVAHGSWKTPYAHRGVGEVVESVSIPKASLSIQPEDETPITLALRESETLQDAATIQLRALHSDTWEVLATFDEAQDEQREQLYQLMPGGQDTWQLAAWDDWYEYPRSYWRGTNRRGVDLGEPSRLKYLFHATFGHYGIFSLTPFWLLAPMGMIYGMFHGPFDLRRLVAAIALASVVCLTFYIARPEIDRNYGGVSVCFRWMLWFAPLWLYCCITELSQLSETLKGRLFALGLVALSAFSVSTSLTTPWQSPWIYRFASFLGWLGS